MSTLLESIKRHSGEKTEAPKMVAPDVTPVSPKSSNLLKTLRSYSDAPIKPSPEKPKTGTPEQTVLGKAFDIMLRPSYSTVAAESELLKGVREGVDYGTIAKNVRSGFMEGLKGKRKMETKDLLHQLDPLAFQEDDYGTIGAGFVLDILNDWSNLIPTSVTAKGVEGIGKAAKFALGKTDTTKRIASMFKTGFATPEQYNRLKYFAQKGMHGEMQAIIDDMEYLAKRIPEKDRERFFDALADPMIAADWKPTEKKVLGELQARLHGIGKKYVEGGFLSPERLSENYQPRVILRRNRQGEWVADMGGPFDVPPGLFERTKKPGGVKGRKFKTIEEAEDWIKRSGLEKDVAYSKDPIFNYGYKASEQARFIAQRKFVEDVLSNWGTRVDMKRPDIPQSGIRPGTLKYWATKSTEANTGTYLPKGALTMFPTAIIPESKYMQQLKKMANELRKQAESFEQVTKETSEQVTTKGFKRSAEDASKPFQKMVSIVKESLQSRGFTAGEADNMVEKLMTTGGDGVEDVIQTTVTRREIVRNKIQSDSSMVFDLSVLKPEERKILIGVSKDVPVYRLPKEIADDMNKLPTFQTDIGMQWLRNTYDKTLNIWKAYATAANPGFHLRNMYSNWYLMWMGDVNMQDIPLRVSEAIDIQRGRHGYIKTKGGEKLSFQYIEELANRYGVRGQGWLAADIPSKYRDEMNRAVGGKVTKRFSHKYDPVSQDFFWLHGGRKVGTAIEDNARLGLFIDGLIKGKSPEDAALAVKKYLFDYGELTEVEREVFKRAIPFYSWMRKNIPLQFQTMVEKPQKGIRTAKAMRSLGSLEPETDEEKLLRPDYYKDLHAIKTPLKTLLEKNPLYWNPNLPFQDVNRVELKDFVTSLVPALKIGIEMGPILLGKPGVEYYSGREFYRYPGDRDILPIELSWLGSENIPDGVKKTLGIGPTLNRETGDYEPGMDARYLYLIRQLNPFFRNIGRLAEPYGKQTASQEDRYPYNLLSYVMGIKLMPLDTAKQQVKDLFEKKDILKKLKKFNIEERGGEPYNLMDEFYLKELTR